MSKFLGYEEQIKNNNILSVQINLLNRCTSKCKSCRKYTWPDDELNYDDVTKALSVLKNKFGLISVVFSGGDPLLYKDFSKFIDFCVENDIYYSIISTLIINDDDLIKKVAKTAYRIHNSVDSSDNEQYKYIRGVDGLEIVKHNLQIINDIRNKNNKIPVRISSVISKMNYKEVVNLYSFAERYGCLINYYLVHTFDGLKMDINELRTFYDEIENVAYDEMVNKKIISNSRDILASKYDFEREVNKCKRCYLPYINLTINSNGDIYPCCKLLNDNGFYEDQKENAYGNIVNKTEGELINEFDKRLIRNYPLACDLCRECADRYNGLLCDLEKIYDKKEVIFL